MWLDRTLEGSGSWWPLTSWSAQRQAALSRPWQTVGTNAECFRLQRKAFLSVTSAAPSLLRSFSRIHKFYSVYLGIYIILKKHQNRSLVLLGTHGRSSISIPKHRP